MMKRVRGTAKWSQLYKSGPSIPPKNKASYLNNDEEDDREDNAGDANLQNRKNDEMQLMSSGTYRHLQNDFDDMQEIGMSGEMGRNPMDGQRGSHGGIHTQSGLTPDMQVGVTGG